MYNYSLSVDDYLVNESVKNWASKKWYGAIFFYIKGQWTHCCESTKTKQKPVAMSECTKLNEMK